MPLHRRRHRRYGVGSILVRLGIHLVRPRIVPVRSGVLNHPDRPYDP